ncbi:hypothetical protein [Rheinheimera sp. WS51]|uniref:hypothetical protein n=1 Tax=Rheinheimera sp. WS51 TaxID=3425886 RepID=UPI003D9250ED
MIWTRVCFNVILLLMSWLCLGQCNLNDSDALPLQLAMDGTEASRSVLLSHNRILDSMPDHAQLELHDASSAVLLARLSHWHDASHDIEAARIMAEPARVDLNMDGLADAVYVVDLQGRVWFIQLEGLGFASPKLIADFSASEAVFSQPVQLVQTTYKQALAGVGVIDRIKVSLVLLARQHEAGDTVVVFNHYLNNSRLTSYSDLIDRTHLSIEASELGLTETAWRELQQSAGWLMKLDDTVIVKPQIYAGVVYFMTATKDAERLGCEVNTDDETQLFALHLHHAGKVYSQRSWLSEAVTNGSLQLATVDDKLQLKIVNESEQARLIPDMLAITEQCATCTQALVTSDFPKVLRLATYMVEQGAW